MRRHLKTLTLVGAVLTASLAGASAGAAAAASTPVIIGTPDYFVCNNNGVCSPGSGDVGVAYEADTFPDDGANGSMLDVEVWDVNVGATYTMYVTSTGKEIGTMTEVGGEHVRTATIPNPQNVTIKDSLGSFVRIPVTLRVSHK